MPQPDRDVISRIGRVVQALQVLEGLSGAAGAQSRQAPGELHRRQYTAGTDGHGHLLGLSSKLGRGRLVTAHRGQQRLSRLRGGQHQRLARLLR